MRTLILGAMWRLFPRAVHLIDELFVECHYKSWSGVRPDKTRKDCVDFIMNLRSQGVVAHDWF